MSELEPSAEDILTPQKLEALEGKIHAARRKIAEDIRLPPEEREALEGECETLTLEIHSMLQGMATLEREGKRLKSSWRYPCYVVKAGEHVRFEEAVIETLIIHDGAKVTFEGEAEEGPAEPSKPPLNRYLSAVLGVMIGESWDQMGWPSTGHEISSNETAAEVKCGGHPEEQGPPRQPSVVKTLARLMKLGQLRQEVVLAGCKLGVSLLDMNRLFDHIADCCEALASPTLGGTPDVDRGEDSFEDRMGRLRQAIIPLGDLLNLQLDSASKEGHSNEGMNGAARNGQAGAHNGFHPASLPRRLPATVGAQPRGPFVCSSDFRSVQWGGETFTFTPRQAACIRVMWEARQEGTPELDQVTILGEAESGMADSPKPQLRRLFQRRMPGKKQRQMHEAWELMIVKGSISGCYRLADPTP